LEVLPPAHGAGRKGRLWGRRPGRSRVADIFDPPSPCPLLALRGGRGGHVVERPRRQNRIASDVVDGASDGLVPRPGLDSELDDVADFRLLVRPVDPRDLIAADDAFRLQKVSHMGDEVPRCGPTCGLLERYRPREALVALLADGLGPLRDGVGGNFGCVSAQGGSSFSLSYSPAGKGSEQDRV
jgi:hypothetical protein